MIKSIKFDYKNRELTVIYDIRIYGNSYENNEFGEKIAIPDSFDIGDEKIITFPSAEALGIIDIKKLEEIIYNNLKFK